MKNLRSSHQISFFLSSFVLNANFLITVTFERNLILALIKIETIQVDNGTGHSRRNLKRSSKNYKFDLAPCSNDHRILCYIMHTLDVDSLYLHT